MRSAVPWRDRTARWDGDHAGRPGEDAGLTDMSEEERYRAGCSIGSGIGGLPGIESESLVLAAKGPKRVSPH